MPTAWATVRYVWPFFRNADLVSRNYSSCLSSRTGFNVSILSEDVRASTQNPQRDGAKGVA